MTIITLPLILDGLIAVLLVATIIYVIRLTYYLKHFKKTRGELESIIKDLSGHITKADKAVKTLNETVDESSDDLQNRLNKANAMFDELDIVVQTGDALANRLEELAIRNRKIAEGKVDDLDNLPSVEKSREDYNERLEEIVRKAEDSRPNSVFSIRDPDMERGETDEDGGFTLEDDEVLSEAERDLYEKLNKSKRKTVRKGA